MKKELADIINMKHVSLNSNIYESFGIDYLVANKVRVYYHLPNIRDAWEIRVCLIIGVSIDCLAAISQRGKTLKTTFLQWTSIIFSIRPIWIQITLIYNQIIRYQDNGGY